MKKTAVILLFFILGVFLFVSTTFATEITVFGPQNFVRTKAKPAAEIHSFSAQEGKARLLIRNGEPDGKNRVSSATIAVNGIEIFKTRDFNQQVDVLEAPVNLFMDNSISVELNSSPGSFLAIQVLQASAFNITITSPANNAVINNPYVMVTGTVQSSTGNEVGVVVNGIFANVSGNEFIANHVELLEGANTITAKASDSFGNRDEDTLQINSTPATKYLEISANRDNGISPMEIGITVETFGISPVADPELNCIGPEIPTIIKDSTTEYSVQLLAEGLYICTAYVTDAQVNIYQDTIGINVISKDGLDAMLQSKWQGMTNALGAGNIEAALRFFSSDSQNIYRDQFTALAPVLNQVVAEFAGDQLLFVEIYDDTATYEIITGREGESYSFNLFFRKDNDGIWKIWRF